MMSILQGTSGCKMYHLKFSSEVKHSTDKVLPKWILPVLFECAVTVHVQLVKF